jgi:DNA repair protein RecO (recombination protein O)
MPLVATEAVVLHAFDYLESSRIVRLATRDAGLVAVLARGARRPRSAFGTMDLFAHGTAQISLKPQRDLHTLTAFDIANSRSSLGMSLSRFTAASMLAELVLRFGHEESARDLFAPLATGLDALQSRPDADAMDAALSAAWQLVAALGFAPAIDDCALCHRQISPDDPAAFALRAGGVLCPQCASEAPARRQLPPDAREAIGVWMDGGHVALPDEPTRKAHRRLLREFLAEHLSDGRELTAFAAWDASERRP